MVDQIDCITNEGFHPAHSVPFEIHSRDDAILDFPLVLEICPITMAAIDDKVVVTNDTLVDFIVRNRSCLHKHLG